MPAPSEASTGTEMADLRAVQSRRSQVAPLSLSAAQHPVMQSMLTTATTSTPRERTSSSPSSATPSSATAVKAASIVLSSPRRTSRRPSRNLSPSQAHGASAAAAADATLPGYTVIDIRSLPPSVTASPERSLAASPAASPAPAGRKSRLKVDTQQLLAAAEEENVSPRTALFLAMKAKAKAEKKRAKKLRQLEDRREKEGGKEEKEQPPAFPRRLQQPLLSSRPATAASSSSSSSSAALTSRESHEPASSLSSSLYSLSLSPELSSLSSSRPRSPSRSLLSDDDAGRTERRLKRSERKNGYRLCKVSGCLEARDRDGHTKYCRAHQGIHTQNNPNERKGQQRLADRA